MMRSPLHLVRRYFHRQNYSKGYLSKLTGFIENTKYPIFFYIIAANIGIYSLHQIGLLSSKLMYNFFTFKPRNFELINSLSYSFNNQSLIGLTITMAPFFLLAKRIEPLFGARHVMGLYLAGAFGGAMSRSLFTRRSDIEMTGSMPSVLSLSVFNLLNFAQSNFLFFGLRLTKRNLLILTLVLLVLSGLSGDKGAGFSGVAGGVAAGVAYRYLLRRSF